MGSIGNDRPTSQLPIVIAGGGCVGLFLALLLSQSSIPNQIIVIESSLPDPKATRAMAHQPNTFPIISKVPGLLQELINAGSQSSSLCFRTGVAHGSQLIAGKVFTEAEKPKAQLLLPQGKFQEVLLGRLRAFEGKCEIRIGSQVTGFDDRGDSVSVQIQSASSNIQESIEAAYLIGADGGHSTVRKVLGASFDGETLDSQLVATDIRFDFHAYDFYDANFIVDTTDYGLIGRITGSTEAGKPPMWRVSYGVPLGMSEDDIKQYVSTKLRKMLPEEGRDKEGKEAFEIVNVAPYKAQQRCASTLWNGRVGLVGDSAHLTNPYAGLGLASGMADASSLSDVLVHVVEGKAADAAKLFSSWSAARREKFLNVVDKPSRMAYGKVRSDVSSPEKLEQLFASDPRLGAMKMGKPMMFPSLETAGQELEGW